MIETVLHWEAVAEPLGILGAGILLGLLAYYILFRALDRLSGRSQRPIYPALARHLRAPSRLMAMLLAVSLLTPLMGLPSGMHGSFTQALGILLIVSTAWLAIRGAEAGEDIISSQYRMDVADNLKARRIRTQIQLLKRVSVITVGVLAVASILMTFEQVRQVGTSILASAGIAGIVLGVAAQRSIGTLVAGIQIAISQPFRIDDVVVVENEFGRVEEITLTYVVIQLWDERRLILPITYFIEKPFQNWTRTSSHILGTVFLYVDYGVPVQAMREELTRVVEASGGWDGQVCALHVSNATDRGVELRVLVSASDSSKSWDLRCEIREKLIGFLQREYPQALPRVRAEVQVSSGRGTVPEASANAGPLGGS